MPRCLLQHFLASMLLESKAQAADAHPGCMFVVPYQAVAGQQVTYCGPDHVCLTIPCDVHGLDAL